MCIRDRCKGSLPLLSHTYKVVFKHSVMILVLILLEIVIQGIVFAVEAGILYSSVRAHRQQCYLDVLDLSLLVGL